MEKRGKVSSKQEYKNYFKDFRNNLSLLYGNIEINKQFADSLKKSIAQFSLNNPLYPFKTQTNNQLIENQNNNTNNDEEQNNEESRYGGEKGTRPGMAGLGPFPRNPNKGKGGKL